VHAVTGGPWSFGYRPSYLAAPLTDQLPDGGETCVQRPAGLRRPQPRHPARVPRAGHPAER
jgi:hypothetical protein